MALKEMKQVNEYDYKTMLAKFKGNEKLKKEYMKIVKRLLNPA
jgi:hypothetical protein